jgi:heme/copper-type cytochrome/quinol oxidase subunit 2
MSLALFFPVCYGKLTSQQFSAILQLMNEKELSKETPKAPETLKEQEIKKIYNIFGLIQNIFIWVFPILILYLVYSRHYEYNPFENTDQTLTVLFSIGFLINILFIIIGIVFYFNKTNKNKKTFGKKSIKRGIVGVILVFMGRYPLEGITSISTYTHAKELGIVVCQDFHHQVFISSKKKGNLHKQNLHFS